MWGYVGICGDISRIESLLLSLLLLMPFGQKSWSKQDVLHIPQGAFFFLRSQNDKLSFWTLEAWCCGKLHYSGAEPSVRLSFGTQNEFLVEYGKSVSISIAMYWMRLDNFIPHLIPFYQFYYTSKKSQTTWAFSFTSQDPSAGNGTKPVWQTS